MKFKYKALAITGLVVLGAALPQAWAEWGHHRHGGIPGMMAVWPVLQPNQREQIRQIYMKERPVLEAQHRSLRLARLALAQALLSNGDVESAEKEVERAHHDLFQEKVKIAQQIVALLSPTQRSAAAQLLSKVNAAHQEIESAFEEARKSAGGTSQQ